ncbi:MAG: hydrogenase nickel incorporation protein HypB [Flavisolibacter sp.]
MCATCGCDSNSHSIVHSHDDQHSSHQHGDSSEHHHQHAHDDHGHDHSHGKSIVEVEKDVLHQNNLLAARNRGYFDAKNILALNLVSSPGSGKTTLLERTLIDLKGQIESAVVEGDQQTTNDADRIHATGTKVVQINTGKGCHLDAHMVLHAVQGMKLANDSVLFIENVGNLVCPAMFDLGEKERVVIMSVTEGEDKPLKYPDMFYASTVCIINKIDLLPYVPFNIEKAREYIRRINPKLKIIELSCTSGEGLAQWYDWLKEQVLCPVSV